MGEFAEAVGKFVEPASKLVEILRMAYEPRYTRKIADAKAHEIRTIAASVRENSDIPIKYTTSQGADIDASSIEELRERAADRILQRETKRQQNLDNIAQKSYSLLEGGEKIPNEPVDEDWISRFLDYAQDINSEKMQEMWAKILAGKVKHPKYCSLRTLECLHNLSQEEALLFQRLSQFFVENSESSMLPREIDLLENFSVKHIDIMRLDECGLINSQPMLKLDLNFTNGSTIVGFSDVVLKFTEKNTGKESKQESLACYPLTESGVDLLRVINWKSNKDFIVKYANELCKKHNDLEISIHHIIGKNGANVTFANEKIPIN